jgi:uncharacterized membrane protein YkgB
MSERQYPWRRFFARSIDISVISSLILIPYVQLSERLYSPYFQSILRTLIVMLILFIAETIMLSLMGTTLGKRILNIKVIAIHDSSICFTNALKRSFFVYMRGQAFGLPIISLFTELDSYYELRDNGSTSWDDKADTKVLYDKIGIIRVIIAMLLIISPGLISIMVYVL